MESDGDWYIIESRTLKVLESLMVPADETHRAENEDIVRGAQDSPVANEVHCD